MRHDMTSLSPLSLFWDATSCHIPLHFVVERDTTSPFAFPLPRPGTLALDATRCHVPSRFVLGCDVMLCPLALCSGTRHHVVSPRTSFWDVTPCCVLVLRSGMRRHIVPPRASEMLTCIPFWTCYHLPLPECAPHCTLSSNALPHQHTPSPLPLKLHDEATHASVTDDTQASRVASHMCRHFAHSDRALQMPSPRSFPLVVPVDFQNHLQLHRRRSSPHHQSRTTTAVRSPSRLL
jgi:hypothetical protein